MKSIVLLFSIIFLTSCGKTCVSKNCSDFSSQSAAQSAYNSNSECYSSLDNDNDGKACEQYSYPSNNSGCANTTNCGCSGKNKQPCIDDSCCDWIIGTGCKCK